MTEKNETGSGRQGKTSSGSPAKTKRRDSGSRWPRDVRLRLARSVVEERLPTSEVAESLGVPYTTALEWVKRYRSGGAAAFDAVVHRAPGGSSTAGGARREAILATQAAEPQAGSRRIRDVMKRFLGIGASETTVRRVLKEQRAAAPRVKTKARSRPPVRRFERAGRTSSGSRISSRSCCGGTSGSTWRRSSTIIRGIS